jgi:hypothetical protein
MKLLRISRYLRVASLALVIAAIGTTQASAGLVLAGNTHPFDTVPVSPPSANGIVAFAVYSGGPGNYGDATVNAIVDGGGGNYAYLFALQNIGASSISTWTVNVDPSAIVTFGNTSGTGTTFTNPSFTIPPSTGGPTDPMHLGGPTPAYTGGGVGFISANLGVSFLQIFTFPALAPGQTSAIVWYTSNFAPASSTATGIQTVTSSNAQGTIPLASPLPEPATVAMFATAIPFGLLYLKRRKASLTV